MIIQATMKLRWVEVDDDRTLVPVAMIPGYPEAGHRYYKLQQWWQSVDSADGEWKDIEVDWNA